MPKLTKTEIRAQCQALYETVGYSIADLARKFSVSGQTIQTWKQKGEWVKNKNSTKLVNNAENALIQKAQECGLTKELVYETTVGILGANKAVFTKDEHGQTDAMEYPDYSARAKGVDLSIKMLGLQIQNEQAQAAAPVPIIITGEGGKTLVQMGSQAQNEVRK